MKNSYLETIDVVIVKIVKLNSSLKQMWQLYISSLIHGTSSDSEWRDKFCHVTISCSKSKFNQIKATVMLFLIQQLKQFWRILIVDIEPLSIRDLVQFSQKMSVLRHNYTGFCLFQLNQFWHILIAAWNWKTQLYPFLSSESGQLISDWYW